MEYTQTELISAALRDPSHAPMTLADIVSVEIQEFKRSAEYRIMAEAEQYYRNRSDVQNKTNEIKSRSNTKIEHPILKKLIDQKAHYLLAKPWSVDTKNKAYGGSLNELFDPQFRAKILSQGKAAVKSGISWMQPYFDGQKLLWMRIPSTEIIPLWADSEHTKLDAFIRFYAQTVYVGRDKRVMKRAEYWDANGVQWFIASDGTDNYKPDNERGNGANHFDADGKPYNWAAPPIVWTKYNEEELPLNYYIKTLIDDINWQTSVTADVLRDVAKFIYILKNYGGQDLDEFIRELRQSLAIKVDADGGVDKLQADLNIEAVLSFLEKQRRDVFDFGSAVDTKDPDLGNASGTAINFRYMDLDTDCTSLGMQLKDTFQQMKPFLDTYLQMTGKGNFSQDTFDVVFNADMPVNETDIINNAKTSQGLISTRTILQNHPWVEDVEEEEKALEEEKKKAMEEFGQGLFDSALAADEGGEPDAEE